MPGTDPMQMAASKGSLTGSLLSNASLRPRILTQSTMESLAMPQKPSPASNLGSLCRESPVVDIRSYARDINDWARHGDIQNAERCLQDMIDQGIQPNEVCYSCVLKACMNACKKKSRTQASDRAVHWLQVMLDAGDKGLCSLDLEARKRGYNMVIKACAESRNLMQAEFWMNQLQNVGLKADKVTYTCVINACAKKPGDLKKAEEWFSLMQNSGIEPDLHCYSSIIIACGHARDSGRAEYWFQKMLDDHVVPNRSTYQHLLTAFDQAGSSEFAQRWSGRMREAGLDPSLMLSKHMAQYDGPVVSGDVVVGGRVKVKVAALRHTHDCLQPLFTCGRSVDVVVEDLLAGRITPAALPTITVVNHNGKWYSANNRRLWCLKQAGVDTAEAIVGDVDEHFLKGLNNKIDGWHVQFFPHVICPNCSQEFVNRTLLQEHILEHLCAKQ